MMALSSPTPDGNHQIETYRVHLAERTPGPDADWDAPFWQPAETADIAYFYLQSSDHRPKTQVRLLVDAGAIYGIFKVQDRYVRCLQAGFQEEVWKDACVEFFVSPRPGSGYFNFEMNCGGGLLSYFIKDASPRPGGFADYVPLSVEEGRMVQIAHSLPSRIDPEISSALVWTLQFTIPLALFETYLGPLGEVSGQEWRGNFYKCAENNSHPHWASWQPLPELRFHRPDCFGMLILG